MKLTALFLALPFLFPQDRKDAPLFSFGAVADCQYCDKEGTNRRYRLSPKKLAECVADYNRRDLKFVVHLGDFIDRDFKSFSVVNPIFARLKAPGYHVLGNHDFSVADEKKAEVPGTLGMPSKYYDFKVEGWRFLVLDGNDIGLKAYPKDSPEHAASLRYFKSLPGKPATYNGAVGPKQLEWIRSVLKTAEQNGESVALFCHFPVYPENVHNLWNAKEVLDVLEGSSAVKAYINGHNHRGHYGMRKGIHYLTLKGMVDTEKTAYSVIRVYKDRLEVVGTGRQDSRSLLFGGK